MKLKKLSFLLSGIALFSGLNYNSVNASGVTVSGSINFNYSRVIDGGMSGTNQSVWENKFYHKTIHITHFHPKLNLEISDKVNGEVVFCFSDDHGPQVWVASVEYLPMTLGFGNTPIVIVIGRFIVPFGDYNIAGLMPENLKTESRPLMYVDHSQVDMQLENGPRPIFMTPYFDTGIQLYGNLWLRGEQDQLWYGVYLVNGLKSDFTGKDVKWETESAPASPNTNLQVGGRISYSFEELFAVGASYLTSKPDSKFELKNTIYGGDLHIILGKINLRFEYTENPIRWVTGGTNMGYIKKGGYFQIDFPFTFFLGEESNIGEMFELAAMVSALYGDKDKPDHTFLNMNRLAVVLSFLPDPALKFKLEYQYTMLGDYNNIAANVSKYGESFDKSLSKIQLGVGLSF